MNAEFRCRVGSTVKLTTAVKTLVNAAVLNVNVLLTVHLGITLLNDQLDAQLLYFIIRLLQSSTCFQQRHAHHQEVKLYSYSIWYSHSL